MNFVAPDPTMTPSTLSESESGQRDQYRALQRKAFDEMGRAGSRWRLMWVAPFNVFVLLVLVVRGESVWRGVIQGVCVLACITMFAMKASRRGKHSIVGLGLG